MITVVTQSTANVYFGHSIMVKWRDEGVNLKKSKYQCYGTVSIYLRISELLSRVVGSFSDIDHSIVVKWRNAR